MPKAESQINKPMKKIYYILSLLLCVCVQSANAQMGVNSTGAVPATSAMLDVSSTTKGFLPPRMTSLQRISIASPINGLTVYDSDLGELYVRRFGSWSPTNIPRGNFSIVDNTVATPVINVQNLGNGPGLKGLATSGIGTWGESSSGYGLYGISSSSYGVYSYSGSDHGIYASTAATFASGKAAIFADGSNTYGVRAMSSTVAIRGDGTSTGLLGASVTGTGTFGQSDTYRGVWGRGITTGDGVYGDATTGKGVYGQSSSSGTGVYGESVSGNGGFFTSTSGIAVGITSTSGSAINGTSSSTFATASFANFSSGSVLSATSFGSGPAINMTGALKVSGTATTKTAFKVVSAAPDIFINQLIIPNTTLANSPTDILIVTHNYGTGAVGSFNKAIGVIWDLGLLNWRIYVEDGTAMPVGATFNVLVIKQ